MNSVLNSRPHFNDDTEEREYLWCSGFSNALQGWSAGCSVRTGVFNLADVAVVAGCFIFVVGELRKTGSAAVPHDV